MPAAPAVNGAIVRRIVMKDALSAEAFKVKLETMKASGLFKDAIAGVDPKKPVPIEISFLVSGNYLLVAGSKDWVDANLESVRLMAYLFERPRAHLLLNLRVVQLTGPANADVIQMTETVRGMVDAQREEVVRTFSDLEDYLTSRIRAREGNELAAYKAVKSLFPTIGDGSRPMTVPEILVLLMLDRSSPAPRGSAIKDQAEEETNAALLDLPRRLDMALRDPQMKDSEVAKEIQDELVAWKKAVTAARDWTAHYASEIGKGGKGDKGDGGNAIGTFADALSADSCPLPSWLIRRLSRSLNMTQRLYPNLVNKHVKESLEELSRRFTLTLERCDALEKAIAAGDEPPAEMPEIEERKKDKKMPPVPVPAGRLGRNLLALKSLAEELVPAPLALFEAVAAAADNAAPTPEQFINMFRTYSNERRKVDVKLMPEDGKKEPTVNYAKLQALEAGLNLWLRRVSEGMARALEQQFYRRYTNEIRLLANKELGKGSNKNLLTASQIDEVPDVTRDLLLSDSNVNIFVSNSVSLQFSPDTANTVSAQVQASLPEKTTLQERISRASAATPQLATLGQQFGINGEALVKALLAGGQEVPVQSGINLTATPSIGFDASTVSLQLTANQTLAPNNEKVADRVTNHSINNATITALSYEPMVLSTLASNVSYFEESGGIPILRKAPFIKDVLKDIPFKPFRPTKRQKGVYQSSVLILEPVVIPTIEDLVRFHGGWRDDAMLPIDAANSEEGDELPAGAPGTPENPIQIPIKPATPAMPPAAPAPK